MLRLLAIACFIACSAAENNSTLSFKDALMAGAGARVFAQTVLHPLEVVRTRTQAFRGKTMPELPLGSKAALILKGIVPQVVLAGPAGALQFGALEWAKKWLRENAPQALVGGSMLSLWAGFFGAFVAAVVRIPQENIKQPCQARYLSTIKFNSLKLTFYSVYEDCVAAVKVIWGLSGLGGFYKGASVTLARDILWNGLSYAFFINWKSSFMKLMNRDSTESENLIIGALGGALAALFTQPLDVAKTRIMVIKSSKHS